MKKKALDTHKTHRKLWTKKKKRKKSFTIAMRDINNSLKFSHDNLKIFLIETKLKKKKKESNNFNYISVPNKENFTI